MRMAGEKQGGSNRFFFAFIGALALAGVALTFLIFVNRPILREGAAKIAEDTLTRAADAAERISSEGGSTSFEEAIPVRLRLEEADTLFIDPDQASNDPDIVSVYAAPGLWAGAARADTGGCYWIRVYLDGTRVYGTGTDCSGDEAAVAVENGWPNDASETPSGSPSGSPGEDSSVPATPAATPTA